MYVTVCSKFSREAKQGTTINNAALSLLSQQADNTFNTSSSSSSSSSSTTPNTTTMAEEPDFFKPHPHPTKARVKNSMFNMVPDAFEEKTLTLTGDIRRVKQKPVEEEEPPAETSEEQAQAEPEAEGERTPVQESMVADTQQVIEAHPWDHPDAVSGFGLIEALLACLLFQCLFA